MKKNELLRMVQSLSPEQQGDILVRYIGKSNEEQRWFLEKIISEMQQEGTVQDRARGNIQMPQELIDEKMERFRLWLEALEEGELSLEASGYEDYSQGYWDRDWIWEYEDTDGIGEKLAEMISFTEDCIHYGHYPEASEILRELWSLEILADTEDDAIYLGLDEVVSEGLLHADLPKLARQALYAAYWASKPEERAKNLYSYFGNAVFQSIKVQDSFRIGREELPNLESFWEDWIRLLEDKAGDLETRLLEEAVVYCKGLEGLEELASRNYNTHPTLALSVLKEYGKCLSFGEMEGFGVQALEHMDVKLKLRARIALATAFAASHLEHPQQERACLLEAFRSDTSIRNLLRLYGNDQLAEGAVVQAKELIQGTPVSERFSFGMNQELMENVIDKHTYYECCFFMGEFETVKKKTINPKGSLGWTGKFIRTGLVLFLVYLYDGPCPTTAIDYFIREIGFGKSEGDEFPTVQEKELMEEAKAQGTSLFWSYFQRWKKYFPMEQEVKETYYSWALKIIYARADAIVSGQFRNHYGESAALLAALGDIQGSWGATVEKGRIQSEYKRKFPRHSSFQAEMRRYFG